MKTCITVYSWGGMPSKVPGSYIDLAAYIVQNKKEVAFHTISDDALISRSRCRSTKRAMDSKCDVWVQLDHDIEFKAEDIFRMAELAVENDAAVCIPYSCRALPPQAAVRQKPGHPITHVGEDKLVPITFFASGCVAIPMSCIEETIRACSGDVPSEIKVVECADSEVDSFPTLWKPLVAESKDGLYEYLSEDYSASLRMTFAGVPQLAWLKPQIKHWGECGYFLPTAKKD